MLAQRQERQFNSAHFYAEGKISATLEAVFPPMNTARNILV
jgi:hypothetical protein